MFSFQADQEREERYVERLNMLKKQRQKIYEKRKRKVKFKFQKIQ